MLCEMICCFSSVIGPACRQQEPVEEFGQFAEAVEWQDFGNILVWPDDDYAARFPIYFT